MQVIIDISEELYRRIFRDKLAVLESPLLVGDAIKNGIPFPKGHGRIIDESKIKRTFTWDNGYIDCDAPTLIEADGGDTE